MSGGTALGIAACGGYVPRLRLARRAIVEANAWFNPGLKSHAAGARAICNWDEDAMTMAVEAARDCLASDGVPEIDTLLLASTTLPFLERHNAGVVRAALALPEHMMTLDVTASQRAATSALITALQARRGRPGGALVVAAEQRRARTASAQELSYGDAAAALVIAETTTPIAEFIGAHQVAVDFVDHYRGQHAPFDYQWEERWIRDEGYLKIVPRTLRGLAAATGLAAAQIGRLVIPVGRSAAQAIAKAIGAPPQSVCDDLSQGVGDSGAAHPLVMLAHALEHAVAGEIIVAVGWGQGCDAIAFRATGAAAHRRVGGGIGQSIARGVADANYMRYLAFNRLVEQEQGMRAEADRQTALSAFYRHRDMVTALVGGRCVRCGTPQFPPSSVCVNPECQARGEQEPFRFADAPAHVQSWTADNLTYCPDPPQYFGMIVFEGGGRMMVDFTDVDRETIATGAPVRMVFRVKERDSRRGFVKYFWKAVPGRARAEEDRGDGH
ncbi:MAG: hydroxymethylglutaryl-CoA synthase family protein [Burkholderiales bacterium]|nr:hydroxymethylglutaryl-CoA synthase family protein [Burkholderiales bacterium]